MNVDALESAKWKNVADVLRYFSVFAIVENNPEAMKKAIEILLGIVGLFYPIANTAQGLLTKVPNNLFAVLTTIGGLASPEYLIYRGVRMIADKKSEKAKELAQSEADLCDGQDVLIIVCKNKLLSTELNNLINLEDDIDDQTIVGTKDGTVHTIIWNEPAWEAFRDKLTDQDKVLIIGKVKNAQPLAAEQIRFDQFGVRYGWSDNVASIEADPKVLSKKNEYNAFLSAMNDVQVSDKLKKNKKLKFDLVTAGKLAIFPPLLLRDIIREDAEVRKQQLLFGIYNFYIKDLDGFLHSKEDKKTQTAKGGNQNE